MPPFAAHALMVRGGRALALRALVGLTGEDPETRSTWVHIAPEGEWNGHADGAFSLTGEDFKSCIAAFQSQANPIRLDYEHASLSNNYGQPVPSAGYIQKLELRDDGLWAFVEFTKRCAEMIRAGEARFCSGVFVFGHPDRKSGEEVRCELHSLAMTDTPFVDGQTPIALSLTHSRRLALSGAPMTITRAALDEALDGLKSKEFDPKQLMDLVEGLAKMAEAADPKAAEKDAPKDESVDVDVEELAVAPALSADPAAPVALAVADGLAQADANVSTVALEGTPGEALMGKLAAATGLDEAGLLAALETNLDAVVAALVAGAAPAPGEAAALGNDVVTSALRTTLEATQRELTAYRKRDKDAADAKLAKEIDAEVDALVASGKILPAKRAETIALGRKSPAQFRALSQVLAPNSAFPAGAEASAHTPPRSESQSLTETVIDIANPRVVQLNAALDQMKVTDPERRSRFIRNALSAG